eukprot:TRINITY_DN1251_c0_g1_i1.p2 TRINITY_DN1251_c0_g1~~TRINITY_DN1251_c0_g1_i1.p2  ORF type:complete len:237 (+),score=105.53 TRINITY_DN1251_c0_g1_i1:67-711(+)
MPAKRRSSPTGGRDKEIMMRIRACEAQRREQEKREEAEKSEEKEKVKEWEDSMVAELELYFNAVFALVFVSLPASEDPPDWLLSGIILVFNILWNWLVFRSTWLDRINLYVFNFVLVNSGEWLRRVDELPAMLPLLEWNLVLHTNILFVVLGWWYLIRPAKESEKEWWQNIVGCGWFFGNILLLLAFGVLEPAFVLRYFGAIKNLLLSGTFGPG